MRWGGRKNGSFCWCCHWWPFHSMCKQSLEVGSFFSALPARVWGSAQAFLSVLGMNKNTIRPKFKPSNNPTSAKFSDCNQVRQPCRLLGEAAVEVEETGHGQDNKRSAGVGCVRVLGGRDVWRLWPQSDKILWDLCEKIQEQRQEKAVVAYHSISYVLQNSPFVTH